MDKRKSISNDLQNTTQKTKELSNTNYQQPDDELGGPSMVRSFYSTGGTHVVAA